MREYLRFKGWEGEVWAATGWSELEKQPQSKKSKKMGKTSQISRRWIQSGEPGKYIFLGDNSFFFFFFPQDKSQSLSFVRELDHLDFRKASDIVPHGQMTS